MWVPMNSPGPPQPRFDILSWPRTTWTLRTPRVPRGHFVLFVPNPYNMGVYELPWTPATKIWHFELTQDHLDTEDTEGNQRSLCHLCFKPLQYRCLLTPLGPSNQDLTFRADSGPKGHWGYPEVTVIFGRNPYNIGVYRLPWTPTIRIWYLYTHMYGCLYYNPLGSRSEQGRPEGPILRVEIIAWNQRQMKLKFLNFQKMKIAFLCPQWLLRYISLKVGRLSSGKSWDFADIGVQVKMKGSMSLQMLRYKMEEGGALLFYLSVSINKLI